jgi:hypothetical protein
LATAAKRLLGEGAAALDVLTPAIDAAVRAFGDDLGGRVG